MQLYTQKKNIYSCFFFLTLFMFNPLLTMNEFTPEEQEVFDQVNAMTPEEKEAFMAEMQRAYEPLPPEEQAELIKEIEAEEKELLAKIEEEKQSPVEDDASIKQQKKLKKKTSKKQTKKKKKVTTKKKNVKKSCAPCKKR